MGIMELRAKGCGNVVAEEDRAHIHHVFGVLGARRHPMQSKQSHANQDLPSQVTNPS